MTTYDETTPKTTTANPVPDRVMVAAQATKHASGIAARAGAKAAGRALGAAGTAQAAATAAAKRGAWIALCRLGRGLWYALPDYLEWVLDLKRLAAYEAAEEAKDSKGMLLAEKERAASKHARAALSAVLVLGVVVLWTGGSAYVTVLAGLITLAVMGFLGLGAAARPGAAFGASLLIEIAHAAYGIPDALFTYGTPTLLVAALMVAARDGHVMPKDTTPAAAEEPAPDARVDSIEAAVIASVKGLDPESKPRVVEPGIAWTADRTVWTATVDSGGPSGERLVGGSKDIAARLGLGLGRLHMLVDEDRGSRVHFTGVVGNPWAHTSTSPLMRVQEVDTWEPLPFGRDIAGSDVTLEVPGSNFLFGGMPTYGKSTAAANVWGAFLLSPRSRLWVIDGGEVDTEPLHRAGLTHEWCTDPHEAASVLRDWNAEIDRRQNLLAAMGKRKADREFFTEHRIGHDLLMWDEVASYTDSADRKLAGEITRLGKSALQRCRKAGMVMLLSTQSPSASALDSDARDTIHWRWAGWCRTREMSDKILGDGMAGRGVNASLLDRRIKGVGWLSTAEGDRIVRPHYLDDDELIALIDKARRLRGAAGLLRSGDPAPAELVAMAEVMRSRDVEWISAEDLIASGGAFDGHDPVTLAAALPEGVRTAQIKEDGYRRRYRLADVDHALAQAR